MVDRVAWQSWPTLTSTDLSRRTYAAALRRSRAVDRVIVVSTSDLTASSEAWLSSRTELLRRANFGYDFWSRREGLAAVDELDAYDEVVILNDTFVGPLRSYSSIFAEMKSQPVDYWGLTACQRIAPHLQGNLLVFRPWVVASSAFREFWERMVPLSDRSQVIRRHEVGLSQCLQAAGFRGASYFLPTREDEITARRRVAWWAEHRPAQGSQSRPPRTVVQARALEPCNPVYALADRALDGRLPIVKIDTLRHDPYKLGADALLRKFERKYPHEFSGVREFLDRTASHYPTRPGERLLRTPARAWVMWPSVRY